MALGIGAGAGALMRIAVVLDPSRFAAGMAAVKAQATTAGTALNTGLGVGAVATAVGFAKAAGAAMEWEDSMAGVRRTVNLSNDQLARSDEIYGQIEDDLRQLTKVIPVAHTEIAQMAETAGALGVPSEAISEFVRVSGSLSQLSDDLTPDQTARSMGKIRTVMGLATKDFNRFGSAVVELGVSGASTEQEIISMAQRASGAFGSLGISVPKLLGWSAAMANVGEKSEAGGTTLQRLGLILQRSVIEGGPKLEATAKAAGVTTEAFQNLFGQDASKAMFTFIEGLSKLDETQRSIALRKAGFIDIRLTRGLLKIVNALGVGLEGNLLDALEDSARGWEENAALGEMAADRWNTTAKKWVLFTNKLRDFGITIGAALLPFIDMVISGLSSMVDGLATLVEMFPGLTAALVPVLAGLSAILALNFGARLIGSLLPGTIATGVGAAWSSVGATIATAVLAPLKGISMAARGIFGRITAMMGVQGLMAGRAFGLAFKAAALGVFGLLLIALEVGIQELVKTWEGVKVAQAAATEAVDNSMTQIEAMEELVQLEEKRAELLKGQAATWEGQAHGLKLVTDFFDPKAGHAFENQLEEVDRRIAMIKAGMDHMNTTPPPPSLESAVATAEALNSELARTSDLVADVGKAGGGRRPLGDLFQLPKDFQGGIQNMRRTIAQGRRNVVMEMHDFWEGIKQAIENPPVKLMSRGARIKQMDRMIRQIEGQLKAALNKRDPISIEYWNSQLIEARSFRKKFVNSHAMTTEELRALYQSLGMKIPKFMRKARNGAKSAQKGMKGDAKDTKSSIMNTFGTMNLFQAGFNMISTMAKGILAAKAAALSAANHIAGTIAGIFVGKSPPPFGPLSTIDKAGTNLMTTYARGMLAGTPVLERAGMKAAGAALPNDMGLRAGYSMGRVGGGDVIQVGTLIATEQGLDELNRRLDRRKSRRTRGRRLPSERNR